MSAVAGNLGLPVTALYLCTNLQCRNKNEDNFDFRTCYSSDIDFEVNYFTCMLCNTVCHDVKWMQPDLTFYRSQMRAENLDLFSPKNNILSSLGSLYDREENITDEYTVEDMPLDDMAKQEVPLISESEMVESVVLKMACECGNSDPRRFVPIQDLDTGKDFTNVKCCVSCASCCGVDDSVSILDIQKLCNSKPLETTPCVQCGNTDHNKFSFVEIFDKIDLHCLCCNALVCGVIGTGGDPLPKTELHALGHVVPGENTELEDFDKYGSLQSPVCGDDNENGQQFSKDTTAKPELKGHLLPKTRVNSLNDLKEGDHIAWHRMLGYWHHALVVEVRNSSKMLKVIEYAQPKFFSRMKIMEHWIKANPKKTLLYRIEYKENTCIPPSEVIRLARERLGEKSYDVFTSNCEHFCIGCKQGNSRSSQVDTLKNVAKRIGLLAPNASALGMFDAVVNASNLVTTEVLKAANIGHIPMAAFSVGTVVMLELFSLIKGIRKAMKMKATGEFDSDAFSNYALKLSVGAGTVCLCAGAGAVIGTFFTPIGTAIGSLVGALLGHLLGPILGRLGIEIKEKILCCLKQKQVIWS